MMAGRNPFVRLRRTVPLWLALGVAVMIGFGVAGDLPRVVEAMQRFDARLAPAILGLTLLNYLLRFVKWGYYLRLIGAPSIPPFESGAIFFSGLAMTITPAKLGEWLKSYLLLRRHGVPFGVSAPVILAERLTDGLAMLLLALGGLYVYGLGLELAMIVAIGSATLVIGVRARGPVEYLLGRLGGLPFVGRVAHHAHDFYRTSRRLLEVRPLFIAVGLGVVSWAGECVAFSFVLVGLGIAPTADLLLTATFILAVATLVGSLSMVPGGLAVADGSIAGLLMILAVTDDAALAVAATLLIRLATLWFGVLVGLIAISVLVRSGRGSELSAAGG